MNSELKADIEKQVDAIKKELETNKDLTIAITDSLCALDFKKYAETETWEGNSFEIFFINTQAVEVTKEDFLRYQFQYTPLAIELEDKYSDNIDELRDAQQDVMREFLED